MHVVCDIETNALFNPTKIWCIVCREVDNPDNVHIFENVTDNEEEKERFINFARTVTKWIGHNFIEFDAFNINSLVCSGLIDEDAVVDTLILSRLVDYSRKGGHSLEQYGSEFNVAKVDNVSYATYSTRLLERCVTDTLINHKVYLKYVKYTTSPIWTNSILLEHRMASLCNTLRTNGFWFNLPKAKELLKTISDQLKEIDDQFLVSFPARAKLVREIHPTYTKHGTLHRKDFKWVKDGDISDFNGGPFCLIKWEEFNPSSPKQIVNVLNEAGWKPEDKTNGHIDLERAIAKAERDKKRKKAIDFPLEEGYLKLEEYKKVGWKVNEKNLATLPESAPAPARLLAKRLVLESRRKTLTEWIELCDPETQLIHGRFNTIGAWTHRMSHQSPNMANIPTSQKLYGDEMRSLWGVDPDEGYLVGVDAEGIQLRVLAHYLEDEAFTNALVNGTKYEGTDPHNFNKSIIGDVCKHRQDAKRYIYAKVLGGAIPKFAEILKCTVEEARDADKRIMAYYTGWTELKKGQVKRDAERGYFEGLDGRFVKVPGETASERAHLMMSGYLQNGEAIIMKMAALHWHERLTREGIPFWFCDFVHDEWQTRTVKDLKIAKYIAEVQAESIRWAGEQLGVKCPMAGAVTTDHGTIPHSKVYDRVNGKWVELLWGIGTNWVETH